MYIFIPSIISKGDSVVFDVKCSRALETTIKKYGGNPIMYKTGHSLIKNKMLDLDSKFGGEMSGHIFFSDRYYGYDDGIYASLRLVELLSNLLVYHGTENQRKIWLYDLIKSKINSAIE